MPVFFISSNSITNTRLTIVGPLFDHLTKSLRFREGDQLVVCDETRQRHHVHIEKLKKSALEGEIRKTELGPPLSGAQIILGQAMLKGDHMNWAVQKATELGVNTIVPLLTERVIIRPKADRFHSFAIASFATFFGRRIHVSFPSFMQRFCLMTLLRLRLFSFF